MLVFLISYADAEYKLSERHITHSQEDLSNEALGLKASDRDWHRSILFHVRDHSGDRQRTIDTRQKRKAGQTIARRERTKAAKAVAKASVHDDISSSGSSAS